MKAKQQVTTNKPVKKMKKYHYTEIANAMFALGYRNIKTANIEKMVSGLPKQDLERILAKAYSTKESLLKEARD